MVQTKTMYHNYYHINSHHIISYLNLARSTSPVVPGASVSPKTVLRICGVMAPRGSSRAQQQSAEKCMV